MSVLADYQDKFETIVFRREDGILEMRFHTDGGPLRWGFLPHEEAEEAFLHIGRDRENKVVIMTGTGAEFSGPAPDPGRGGGGGRNAEARAHLKTQGAHPAAQALE